MFYLKQTKILVIKLNVDFRLLRIFYNDDGSESVFASWKILSPARTIDSV